MENLHLNAKNELAKIMNDLIPLLEEYFSQNEVIFKKNHQPRAKFKKEIDEIIDKFRGDNIYISLFYSTYYKNIVVKRTFYEDKPYKIGNNWQFVEDFHYFSTPYAPRPIVDADSYIKFKDKRADLQKQIAVLQSEVNKINALIG